MQTALSFTTLSARGTRFRMFPNAFRNAKDSRESVRYNYITRTAQTHWCEIMSKVLLMQILRCSLKNTFLVLDFLLRLHSQCCSVCSLSIRTLCVCWCQQTASPWLWRVRTNTQILTFPWKVPSKAATMTVFPKLAISSQNSTVSGNYSDTKEAQIQRVRRPDINPAITTC